MQASNTSNPTPSLAALAASLSAEGGVWLSVRPRPFGRGALARFWLPDRPATDRFVAAVPRAWEVGTSRHLRRAGDTTYQGWQVTVTVPWAEVDAARRLIARGALAAPTEELDAAT